MRGWFVFACLLFVAAFLLGCTSPPEKVMVEVEKQGNNAYLIKFSDNATGKEITTTATRISGDAYQLENGTIIRTADTRVEVISTLSPTTPICHCNCNCCPQEKEKPCVEPEPLTRYLCADGRIVKNKGDCENATRCDYYAVKKVFVCPNGRETDDPTDCGAVVETLYYCSDGRLVSSEAECGCQFTATVAQSKCAIYYVEKRYKCSDGTIVTTPSACGQGNILVYYICSDGRRVKDEADCSAPCPQPEYPSTAVAAVLPSNAVRIVYECWNGLIVNNKGDCPLYCNKDCVCPEYYKPVCGVDGRTYPNECYARCAGVKIASEGECEKYKCIEQGSECRPIVELRTLALPDLSKVPVCCPGLECLPVSGVPITRAASVGQVRYTCQPPALPCREMGDKCLNDTDCCKGYCVENICKETKPCLLEGERCVATTGATANIPTNMTCCPGMACIGGYCKRVPNCTTDGGRCKLDSECCSGYCDLRTNTCGSKPTCVGYGERCGANSDCCSQYCNPRTQVCEATPTCEYEYCKDGIFYTGCYFDTRTNQCNCSFTKCASGICSRDGRSCGPSCYQNGEKCSNSTECCSQYCNPRTQVCEATPTCEYEYCKDGIFYTGCYFDTVTGGCTCTTQVPCAKQRCSTDGKTCA